VAKCKRVVKTATTGTKQNKAHVKKRKFLRLALALVVQVSRDARLHQAELAWCRNASLTGA
jgi:hypothetical protein